MIENKKYLWYVALWGCFLLFVGACNEGGDAKEATVDLSTMACQPADVAGTAPFTISQTRTAVPDGTFLADQIVDYYGVVLTESSLGNLTVFCDLFTMTDETAAIEMLNRTCTVQMSEADPPFVGEEVCARESPGFRMVNFRQGSVVVSILGDGGGAGVDTWATVVNGRLLQK